VLEQQIEGLFDRLSAVGIALIITGLILLSVNWLAGRKEQHQTTTLDALLIGTAQVLALAPGISRSGTTIAAGLTRGLHRDWAPRFAFLLSAPVILGGTDLLGGLTAAIFGYFAVHLVVRAVRAGNLIYFSAYCILVGTITAVIG